MRRICRRADRADGFGVSGRRGQVNTGLIIVLSGLLVLAVAYYGHRYFSGGWRAKPPVQRVKEDPLVTVYCGACKAATPVPLSAAQDFSVVEFQVQCPVCKQFAAQYERPGSLVIIMPDVTAP